MNAQATLARLRRILICIVAIALAVAYASPTWFEGDSKRIAIQTVVFLHVFLPAWAIAYYLQVQKKVKQTGDGRRKMMNVESNDE